MTRPWPWPGDSRIDKLKRIARSYRALAERIANGRCDDPATALERLDQHWVDLGQEWPVPRNSPLDVDEWVTAADAALYADVTHWTVRKWAQRDLIRVEHAADGTPLYNIGDLIRLEQSRQQRRHQRQRGTA